MAIVFKKGEFGSPARRRNHHVWPEEMKTHLNCRERTLYVYEVFMHGA